jgi:hypothetical protein
MGGCWNQINKAKDHVVVVMHRVPILSVDLFQSPLCVMSTLSAWKAGRWNCYRFALPGRLHSSAAGC